MATNKRHLTRKNTHFKKKSIKIRGSGAGPSTMGHKPISRTRSAPTNIRTPTKSNTSKGMPRNQYATNKNVGVLLRNNTAPAILPTQLKAFKTTDKLKQAVKDYFTNITIRNKVIDEYGNISDWNTSQITDMSDVFKEIKPIDDDGLIVLNWDTSNVTNMTYMFCSTHLNFKINFTTTSNVTNMKGMFFDATLFNQPLPESFDTSNVTDMTYMFAYSSKFNQPVNFNTRNVTRMRSMFFFATEFNQPICFYTNIINVIDNNSIQHMFENTKNLLSPISIIVKSNLISRNDNVNVEFTWFVYDIFLRSKIMEYPEFIKITKHEISFLGDNRHMLAYALTEADKQQSKITGKLPTYPVHTIDLNEFNEYLGK